MNESLEYYEGITGRHIIRVLKKILYNHLNTGLYQTKNSWSKIEEFQLPDFTNDEMNDWIKDDLKIDRQVFTAIGVRAADSLIRNRSVKMHGGVNEKRRTFFPVYDWKMDRLIQEITDSGIKLPIDY